jgi:hypothetical protein
MPPWGRNTLGALLGGEGMMSIPKRAFQRLGAGAPATGALGLGVLRIGVRHVLAVEREPLKVSGDDAPAPHNGTLPPVGRRAGRA